jgi:hypothetical protein
VYKTQFEFRSNFSGKKVRLIGQEIWFIVSPHEMCNVKDDQAMVAQSLRKSSKRCFPRCSCVHRSRNSLWNVVTNVCTFKQWAIDIVYKLSCFQCNKPKRFEIKSTCIKSVKHLTSFYQFIHSYIFQICEPSSSLL